MSSSTITHLDLAKLPVHKKDNLCKILDQNDRWVKLGRLMQFSDFDIDNIKTEANRYKRSPSDVLITRWSSRYAHNTTELFKLLAVMQHFQAMNEIKELVNERYHIWFKSVQPLKEEDKQLNKKSQIFNIMNDVKDECPKDELKDNLKSLLNIPEIPIEQLEEATNGWAKENILGKGGFGTVYKGEWISTMVAIKKLEYLESRGGSSKDHLIHESSLNELRLLNSCRHDNVLAVYGYALKDDICIVVYQLMTGGSLEERLKKRTGFDSLTWPQRWNISKGVAKGLHFLHTYQNRPLIHGDIKPANILLDTCCEPKIGDFGLSREGHVRDECQELSKRLGTKPYLPYEFLERSLFSTKVDVFSYGVVLFEIATGFKAHDKLRRDVFLYTYMARVDESSMEQVRSVIDPSTPNDEACLNLCKLMIYLGKKCSNHNPNDRPNMKIVYKALNDFVPVVTTSSHESTPTPTVKPEYDSAVTTGA